MSRYAKCGIACAVGVLAEIVILSSYPLVFVALEELFTLVEEPFERSAFAFEPVHLAGVAAQLSLLALAVAVAGLVVKALSRQETSSGRQYTDRGSDAPNPQGSRTDLDQRRPGVETTPAQ